MVTNPFIFIVTKYLLKEALVSPFRENSNKGKKKKKENPLFTLLYCSVGRIFVPFYHTSAGLLRAFCFFCHVR